MHNRNIEKTKAFSRYILFTLLEMGGEMLVAALTGSVAATREITRDIHKYTRPKINQALDRYRQQGLLKIKTKDGRTVVSLTKNGFTRAKQLEIRRKSLENKPKRWDGLWRVILFDIPERKKVRRQFWRELKILGFCRLQYSVYVYPHDCKLIMQELKECFHIQQDVLIFTIPSLGTRETKMMYFFKRILNHE